MGQSSEIGISFIILAGMLGMFLLSGVVVVFFLVYKRRLVQERFKLQKLELHHQRVLLDNSLKVQERERKRIAEDIHDEIGTNLSVVKQQLEFLGTRLSDRETVPSTSVETSLQITSDVMKAVRRISRDLLPPTLEEFGLMAALEDHLKYFTAEAGTDIKLIANNHFDRLPYSTQLAIFRIVQELMSNCLKHAKATAMRIEFTKAPEGFHVRVEDNGHGFQTKNLAGNTGMGIKNIQSRAQSIGADVEFSSTPGQGTQCSLFIPHSTDKTQIIEHEATR